MSNNNEDYGSYGNSPNPFNVSFKSMDLLSLCRQADYDYDKESDFWKYHTHFWGRSRPILDNVQKTELPIVYTDIDGKIIE